MDAIVRQRHRMEHLVKMEVTAMLHTTKTGVQKIDATEVTIYSVCNFFLGSRKQQAKGVFVTEDLTDSKPLLFSANTAWATEHQEEEDPEFAMTQTE
jgi:hypothetical protein